MYEDAYSCKSSIFSLRCSSEKVNIGKTFAYRTSPFVIRKFMKMEDEMLTGNDNYSPIKSLRLFPFEAT